MVYRNLEVSNFTSSSYSHVLLRVIHRKNELDVIACHRPRGLGFLQSFTDRFIVESSHFYSSFVDLWEEDPKWILGVSERLLSPKSWRRVRRNEFRGNPEMRRAITAPRADSSQPVIEDFPFFGRNVRTREKRRPIARSADASFESLDRIQIIPELLDESDGPNDYDYHLFFFDYSAHIPRGIPDPHGSRK